MPTYDYVCRSCEHEWEVFQSIKAKPVRKCPECGGLKAKRVIGPGAGIIFRGSGFYQTDYRSDSYKKKAAAENSANESASKNGSSDSNSANSKSSGSNSSKAAPSAD